jgi:hypothetical protein
VQAPGSLAPASATPLIPAIADGAVITAVASERTDPRPIPVPVFLGGRTINAADAETNTRWIGLFNPYFNATVEPNLLTPTAKGATVWPRSDGSIWSFGGKSDVEPFTYGGIASQLGTIQILTDLGIALDGNFGSNDSVGIPRAYAAIAEKDGIMYAFGGESLDAVTNTPIALSSLVEINPTAPLEQKVRLSAVPMLAPRIGLTATSVTVARPAPHTDILLFGGGSLTDPVAEIFTDKTFVALGIDAGPMRSGHSVLALPNGRFLILGGVDPAGSPLADARVYDPETRSFSLAPLQLQTPRANATVFVIGNDLVVSGGVDASGVLVPSAERFDLATLAPLPPLPAAPRSGAKAAYLPDGTAILVGGRALVGQALRPTSLIEVYRPRDLPKLF